jgi:hydroxymethylpyrimidine/phosphomethylpyrimidine kinase
MVPVAIVRDQILACLGDIGADAIKTGMLGSAEMVEMVAATLAEQASGIPLVVDPVMVAKGGSPLLDEAAVAVLKKRLLPLASLVTPNLPEAEALTGVYPQSEHRLRNAAMVFKMMGVEHVLFKGGHASLEEASGDTVRDVLWSDGVFTALEAVRQATRHTHGTGCTLATAIACGLAKQFPLHDAVARAHAYVQEAIRTAPELGSGAGPLNHKVQVTG